MKPTFEKNLIYRIVKYGVEEKEIFTIDELTKKLALKPDERDYMFPFLLGINSVHTDSKIFTTLRSFPQNEKDTDSVERLKDQPCRLLPDAIFQYIDYLEIKAAKESAERQRNWHGLQSVSQ